MHIMKAYHDKILNSLINDSGDLNGLGDYKMKFLLAMRLYFKKILLRNGTPFGICPNDGLPAS